MAASRKLQGEIDRCLKKVSEGVEQFEDIWKKVHNANNTNQKEKYEADLKKEIKKLQRLRDQIKSWLTSGEIKDKSSLLDNRKLIETQMERFKVVERETKTKAYSKEGLGAAQNKDPAQREREEHSRWLSDRIDNLTMQVDQLECDIEALHAGGKKKKVDKEKTDRIDEKKDWLERHRMHIQKLEILMRMLNNESIDVDELKSIKDDVDYYVESNQDPDFVENEALYDDIEMEDLDYTAPEISNAAGGVTLNADGTEASTPTPSIGSSPSPASSSTATSTSQTSASITSNNSTPASTTEIKPPPPTTVGSSSTVPVLINHSNSNLDTVSSQIIPSINDSTTSCNSIIPSYITTNTNHNNTVNTNNTNSTPSSTNNLQNNHHPVERSSKRTKDDARTPVKPTVVRPNANPPINIKGVQANTPTKGAPVAINNAAMSYLAASQHNAKNANKKDDHITSHTSSISINPVVNINPLLTNHVSTQQQIMMQHNSTNNLNSSENSTNNSLKSIAQKKLSEVALHPNPGNVNLPAVTAISRISTVPSSTATNVNSGLLPPSLPPSTGITTVSAVSVNIQQQVQTATGEAHIPPLLGAAPLGRTPLTAEHETQFKRLQSAYFHMPHPADNERLRIHFPRQPVVTPQHFPQVPPPLSDTVDFFTRLSTETLFFIFYYLEGTKAQYLAAKALKKQSWRFHTKYMMWFQRHEEPKAITDEYEQGTYIFFDYDNWGQRKKENFTFEYRYLEDRDLN